MTLSASEILRPAVQQQRADFIESHQHELPAVDLVFIDECGSNTNLCRTHGRAPAGERVRGHRPVNRGTNQTVVGAITLTGMLEHTVYDGAMTKARFVEWVTTRLAPKLRAGNVVILDNLRAHHAPEAIDAIERTGACVLHLPPYSPDLNPIEPGWSKLKAHVRSVGARTVEDLRAAIDVGIQRITASDCRGWFRHCQWLK